MANHSQAEKRNRQRLTLQAHHRHYRSTMRSKIKEVKTAIDSKDGSKAREALKLAVPFIDRCAQRSVIPRKQASRTIARLTLAVNAIG